MAVLTPGNTGRVGVKAVAGGVIPTATQTASALQTITVKVTAGWLLELQE